MRRPIKTKDLALIIVADAALAWREQSEDMDYRHPAYPYRHHAQYNSNASKYLAPALQHVLSAKGDAGPDDSLVSAAEDAPEKMLLVAIEQDVEMMANTARASFLHQRHGHDMYRALTLSSSELGLDRNTAKSANNVAEAVRRLLRFFRLWLMTCRTALIESTWPATPADLKRSKASVLYNRIRKEMIGRGVMDPSNATPKMISEALRIYTDKANDTADSRHWNSSLKDLRKAVTAGAFPGITLSHLENLTEIRPNPRNVSRTVSEAEAIKMWPNHFIAMPGDDKHFDMEKGLPGFFNKALEGPRPTNPAGEMCPRDRRLHHRTIIGRFRSLRRFLRRWVEVNGDYETVSSLQDAFSPQRIKEWLEAEIVEKGHALTVHRDGYMHALMVAKYYFGHDIGNLVKDVKDNVTMPKDWESTRSDEALRYGTPQTLMEQAEAFGTYAASARLLSEKKNGVLADRAGAGRYLVRKSCQVDLWLRILTGLRPAALDALEVSDRPDRAGSSPKIWREDDGHFIIFIPLWWLKQHLITFFGKAKSKALESGPQNGEVKGFEYEIRRAEAVAAISDYLEYGWRHAKSVLEKRTQKLYLNDKGEPTDGEAFGKAFGLQKSEAYHFILATQGRAIQRHTRYQVRHIMPTFIESHLPGKSLKTTYLTHSADFGSDKFYGKTNMALLREVIDEILDGKLTRDKQQEMREKMRDEKLEAMEATIENLHRLLAQAKEQQPTD